MDPSSQQFKDDLHVLSKASLRKLRMRIWMHKLNETLPEIGPITTLITLGEVLLWFTFPPSLQTHWTSLIGLWMASWLVSIAILSVPRSKTLSANAHWIGGD